MKIIFMNKNDFDKAHKVIGDNELLDYNSKDLSIRVKDTNGFIEQKAEYVRVCMILLDNDIIHTQTYDV